MGARGDTSPWLFSTWHLLTAPPLNPAQQRGMKVPFCSSQTTEVKNTSKYFLQEFCIGISFCQTRNWEKEDNAQPQILGVTVLYLDQLWAALTASCIKPYITFPPPLGDKRLLLKQKDKSRAESWPWHCISWDLGFSFYEYFNIILVVYFPLGFVCWLFCLFNSVN